jgi:hypothetical protein
MSVDLKLWTVTSADAHSGKHPFFCWRRELKGRKKRDRFSNKNYFLTISKATQLFGLFPEPKFKPPPHDKNGNDWKRPPFTEPDLRINAWTGSTTACIPKIFSKIPKKRYFTAVFSDL